MKMMNKRYYLLFFVFVVFSFTLFINNSNHDGQNKPIILVHDVSPIYFKELKEIVKVINKHHYQNRTYLFLIVNHADKYNLEDYPEFVRYLHKLEKEGYHIEFHACNHIGDEFNCNKTVAEEKLNKSFKILEECGFNPKNTRYFIPPRYKLSEDAEKLFLERNITIILENKMIINKNGKILEIRITNREYTWYLPKSLLKIAEYIAIADYKLSIKEDRQFFLTVHPKAVNYGGGLEFLDDFLNETLKN
jgi:predicted deacetylase